MRSLEDPRQSELFNVFADILSSVAYRRLTGGWQHVFRQAILKLMSAGRLAEHFDPQMGRPTQELYSMAGLLFIMEFRNWTHDEVSDNASRKVVRERYEASDSAVFGWKALDEDGVNQLRQPDSRNSREE